MTHALKFEVMIRQCGVTFVHRRLARTLCIVRKIFAADLYCSPCYASSCISTPQFSPLRAFGCDMKSHYPATLFRFPLRTPEQASASRLSRQSHGVSSIRELLRAFAKESAGMLLFLKNVERMVVFEWSPGQSEPLQVQIVSDTSAGLSSV